MSGGLARVAPVGSAVESQERLAGRGRQPRRERGSLRVRCHAAPVVPVVHDERGYGDPLDRHRRHRPAARIDKDRRRQHEAVGADRREREVRDRLRAAARPDEPDRQRRLRAEPLDDGRRVRRVLPRLPEASQPRVRLSVGRRVDHRHGDAALGEERARADEEVAAAPSDLPVGPDREAAVPPGKEDCRRHRRLRGNVEEPLRHARPRRDVDHLRGPGGRRCRDEPRRQEHNRPAEPCRGDPVRE